jgi:hypothetical protein
MARKPTTPKSPTGPTRAEFDALAARLDGLENGMIAVGSAVSELAEKFAEFTTFTSEWLSAHGEAIAGQVEGLAVGGKSIEKHEQDVGAIRRALAKMRLQLDRLGGKPPQGESGIPPPPKG